MSLTNKMCILLEDGTELLYEYFNDVWRINGVAPSASLAARLRPHIDDAVAMLQQQIEEARSKHGRELATKELLNDPTEFRATAFRVLVQRHLELTSVDRQGDPFTRNAVVLLWYRPRYNNPDSTKDVMLLLTNVEIVVHY